MSFYLDTALLVAMLTNESSTGRVQAWLDSCGEGELSISPWVIAEFSSALRLKQRTRQLTADERAAALATFAELVADTLTVRPITNAHFHAAASLVERSTLALRAPDALHLAICSGHGETLCTLDRRLAEAGTALGVKTQLV
ncbi:MAG TPA: type II toxin-antitoxin system VapC family toxin [Stellaceae bacterium]|nr:type II toxin-antitoxin system VapC family toxin [Stellaceae bacterium]